MKDKKTNLLIIAVFLVIQVVGLWIYRENIDGNGRLYSSKNEMCEEFAKSYLRTTRKLNAISDFSGGNTDWSRAIAIESEIQNLCQMELTDQALEGYAHENIKMYLDRYRHDYN